MKLVILCFLLSISNLFATTIKNFKGSVTLNGIQVVKGQKVDIGDDITVDEKGFAQISFDDGSQMLVKSGQIKLQKSELKNETLVELIRGILFSYKTKSVNTLKVRTRYASMGVRGTKFYVQQTEAQTYLCVCDGSVNISNEKSSTDVATHEDVVVKPGQAFQKSKANDMMKDMALVGFKEMGL